MFLNFAGWTSDILPTENVAIAGTTYDIEAINAVDFLMKRARRQGGRHDRPPVLRGRLRRERAEGLEVRRRQARPEDRRAEDHARRPGHDRPGRGVQEGGREGDPVQRRAAAGRLAGRRRRLAEARRADRGQRPGLDAAAADHAGRRRAGRQLLRRLLDGAAVACRARACRSSSTEYKAAYPKGTPSSNGSLYAYAGAQIADAALTKACENKDLTRKGVLDALHSLNALDTGGTVAGTLDFTDPARPPGNARLHREGEQGRAGRAGGDRRAGAAAADAEGYTF